MPPAPRAAPAPLAPSPVGLRATPQSTSEIALAWQAPAPSDGSVVYEVARGGQRVLRSREPTAIDANLRPGTLYCYVVRVVEPAGRASEASVPACGQTFDTSPPTVPAGVVVTARPGNAVEVSWRASTDDAGVAGYEVSRAGLRVGKTAATALREERLAPATEHCWTVKAFDAAGNQSASSDPACLTIPDTTPPSVPRRVNAQASGERVVEVGWEASQDDVGVARYEIQRAGAALVTSTENAIRERGLEPVHRYCYVVRACDAAGNCSAPAPEACATTPDLTPPTSPADFGARARSDVVVELGWAPSTDEIGVVGYELRRGEKVVAAAHTGLTFTESGLRPGTRYCWSLVALDAAGNRSTPVQACATTPDLTPPTAPGRPAAVSVSSSQTFVGWDPSTDDVGVVAYEVLRDGAPLAKVSVTRFRDLRLPANREFCYTVRALDAAGNRSEAGGPACTRTADPSQLASPSDLRVVRVSTTEVLLQWEPSEQAGVLYRIYANGTKHVGLTRGDTYNLSGRMGAQADCYRVSAVDDQGRESPKSNEVCAHLTTSGLTAR